MIKEQDLLNEREQMQEDLMCVLDGLSCSETQEEDQALKDAVCQVIVNGMNRLIEKYNCPFDNH